MCYGHEENPDQVHFSIYYKVKEMGSDDVQKEA
jgi:hypothetical protein